MGEHPYVSSRHAFAKSFAHAFAGALLVIEGSIGMQKLLISKIYAHRPYFTPISRQRSERTPWREQLADWCRANLPVHCFGAAVYALIFTRLLTKNQVAASSRRQPFRMRLFLMRLAVVRVIADVTFYAVHRALHTRALYRLLHKRHHEHTSTGLPTNFHFTATDLLLEGFLPFFVATRALERLEGKVPPPLEYFLLIAYVQWYEIGSHSGKPMPTVTLFPPLAPLYQAVLAGFGWGSRPNEAVQVHGAGGNGCDGGGVLLARSVDARNVEFHNNHHRYSRGNYGITQWLDYVLGTDAKPSKAQLRRTADDNDNGR